MVTKSSFITILTLVLAVFVSATDAFAKPKKKKERDRDHPNYQRYLDDEEFRNGRNKRTTGILVTSIGGGVGGAVFVTGVLWNSCWGASNEQLPKCRRNARTTMAIGGLATAGSLGFGIPMITIGREEMDQARRRIDGQFPVKPSDGESENGEQEAGKNPAGGYTLAVRVLNLEF